MAEEEKKLPVTFTDKEGVKHVIGEGSIEGDVVTVQLYDSPEGPQIDSKNILGFSIASGLPIDTERSIEAVYPTLGNNVWGIN